MSATNETTRKILDFFFRAGIFAWREDTVGVPIGNGKLKPASKTGKPDVMAIMPPLARFLGVEIKTDKDRLRPEQEGFISNADRMDTSGKHKVVLVVKDYKDFLFQFLAEYPQFAKFI